MKVDDHAQSQSDIGSFHSEVNADMESCAGVHVEATTQAPSPSGNDTSLASTAFLFFFSSHHQLGSPVCCMTTTLY